MLMAVRQQADTRLRPHFVNTEDFREAGFQEDDEIAVITLEELDRLVATREAARNFLHDQMCAQYAQYCSHCAAETALEELLK